MFAIFDKSEQKVLTKVIHDISVFHSTASYLEDAFKKRTIATRVANRP